jgi:DNA-binding IclR family transcriptional regulator
MFFMEIKKGKKQKTGEAELESAEGAITAVEPAAAAAGGSARVGMLSYKPVGALLASLSVLRYISAAARPVPLSQITRDLGLNPSTCLNILRTLAEQNYVILDPNSKLYSMGLGVLELVAGAVAQGGDMRAIRALTDLIASSEGVTVTLWKRVQRDRIMLVLESLPPGNMSIKMNVGQRLPLVIGAAGRLMAAYSSMTESEINEQFQAVRLERRQAFREFMKEVEEARDRQWAVDEGHFTQGAASVAVPVLDDKGEAVFAFTATMFTQQYSAERAEALAVELARPAALLASAMPFL